MEAAPTGDQVRAAGGWPARVRAEGPAHRVQARGVQSVRGDDGADPPQRDLLGVPVPAQTRQGGAGGDPAAAGDVGGRGGCRVPGDGRRRAAGRARAGDGGREQGLSEEGGEEVSASRLT